MIFAHVVALFRRPRGLCDRRRRSSAHDGRDGRAPAKVIERLVVRPRLSRAVWFVSGSAVVPGMSFIVIALAECIWMGCADLRPC